MSKKIAASSTLANPLAEMFHANSKGKFVLFNIAQADLKDNGPLMSGSMTLEEARADDAAVLVAGFDRTSSSTSTRYLSLSFSPALPKQAPADTPRVRYYGKLFRNTQRNSPKSPDYSGFITVLPCHDDGDASKITKAAWDAAPELPIAGWRKANASDGAARIECTFRGARVAEHELAF